MPVGTGLREMLAVCLAGMRLSVRARTTVLRFKSTLVIAEHLRSKVTEGTLSTVTAALSFNKPVTLLLAGNAIESTAHEAAQIQGVDTVLTVKHTALEHGLAENLSNVVVAAQQAGEYSHILSPSTMRSKNLIPRVAALLDVQPITDILTVIDPDTFVRPFYAGNAIATVKTTQPVRLLTVRTTAYAKASMSGGNATVKSLSVEGIDAELSKFVGENVTKSTRPDLGSAKVVVSGGRGLKNKDNFKILEGLADKLKAAVGASRAAVDEFHMPNELQVGQTGKVVAPDLYIAVGISGAIQHLSGMKDSKVIVAINKDKEAPIFQVADYGLVGDWQKAVEELSAKL